MHAFDNELNVNLIEDTFKGESGYVEFLCEIHNAVQAKKNIN